MNTNIINTKSNLTKRIFAGLFDYSIIFIVTYLIFDIWGEANPESGTHVTGFPALFICLFWFTWTVGLEQLFGATLGNSIFNLKPISIRKNKLDLTFGQSLKRHLLDTIDLSPLGIGFFLIKNTKNNQRLGDLWAETVVINTLDNTEFVKKFNQIETNKVQQIQKKSTINYIFRRTLSAFTDIVIFAFIMDLFEVYLGTKNADGGYSYGVVESIISFYSYFLIQDLLFRKTLGKRIFKLEIRVLENNNGKTEYKYLRIFARRIFDVFEFVCPFIYLIAISITDKNQKLGDKISKVEVIDTKNYC